MKMRSMSLYESGDSVCAASFRDILQGKPIDPYSADIDLSKLIDITVRGGWPETLSLPTEHVGRVSTEYINTILKKEPTNDDFPKRNTAKFRTLLRAIARNNATPVNISTLSLDLDKEDTASRNTTADYLDDLKRLFIIEDIPGWDPGIRSKTRIRMTPKMIYTDPSLAIAALGLTRERLLKDLKTYGFMFENFCLRDLAIYAEYYGGALYHYRDNSGLEVDAIVELPDGEWGAFEIKLGEHQVENAVQTLKRFKNKMMENGAPPPACLCIITGGGFGRKRDDDVYVIPINSLKP
jgi:predicted AAA+ superfamily ATPase